MKILFFTNIIAPYRVGLFNRLDEYFHGNIKFYFDRKTELNRKWEIDEEQLKFNFELKNTFSYKKVSKAANNSELHRFIYFPFYIFSVVLKEKPNIILTNEFGLRTLFALISGKLIKSKVVVLSEVTEQTEKETSQLKIKIRKFLSKHLDGGIAHGINSFNYLLQLGFLKQRLIISPEAIDNQYFENLADNMSKTKARGKLKLPEGKFIFLYVGQFIQLKGLDLFIKSIHELSEKIDITNIEFIFVGGAESNLEKFTNKDLAKIIKVFDFKEGKTLSCFYKAADCFLFPTRNDVWGMVINEAVASGLPVAVSKYAGCANDLIENDISGIVFDPLDEESFLQTIKFCFGNPDKLIEYANNAKKKLEVFNHSTAAKRIIDFVTHL